MIYRATEYPEALDELFNVLPDGIDKEVVIDSVVKAWGGSFLYVPKCYGYQVTARNTEMMQKYDGKNRDELCNEFKIKKSQFYKILRLYCRKGLMKKTVNERGEKL